MIIVTGGAGFIGSNLVAALNDRGHFDVAVIDRLGTDEKWRNLQRREIAAVVPPEQCFDFLDAHAAEVTQIFHMGAISATTETDADLIARTNFDLSTRLWDWCSWRGTPLIYASSAATYGDGAAGFTDDDSIGALAKLVPLNAYGWSKHVFDRLVARRVKGDGPTPPQFAGLKFFNVYGPNEYHKGGQKSVVAHGFGQIAAGGPLRLFRSHRPDYGDGGQLRDFVWVGDCVDIMLWLMDHPNVSGLFNVGTGQARSFLDLARALFAAADKPERIEWIDTPEAIRAKYQYFTQADMSHLRTAGYSRPFTSLEDGVTRYVREFLATETPYR